MTEFFLMPDEAAAVLIILLRSKFERDEERQKITRAFAKRK